MPRPEIELTAAEWRIMKAVWDHEPCAAPDIQEKLFDQTRWTYSTVRTLMDRMVAKGLLSTEKIRNLSLFRSTVTPAQARRGEVAYALKHAFDGALTPMLQCLLDTQKMSQEELCELEDLIKAKKRAGRKQSPAEPSAPGKPA
jgi:predicted transcriptional regulator